MSWLSNSKEELLSYTSTAQEDICIVNTYLHGYMHTYTHTYAATYMRCDTNVLPPPVTGLCTHVASSLVSTHTHTHHFLPSTEVAVSCKGLCRWDGSCSPGTLSIPTLTTTTSFTQYNHLTDTLQPPHSHTTTTSLTHYNHLTHTLQPPHSHTTTSLTRNHLTHTLNYLALQ